jgi:hypothetical protein
LAVSGICRTPHLVVDSASRSRLAYGGPVFMPEMHRSRQIIIIVMAVLGVLLVVRGAWGGVWPLSIQLIAGVLLLVFAGLRWWTLR